MPNRVLRDWTASETIDQLSEQAELLFVRLIMKADDHGCFYGNPKLLKGSLFPLKAYTENQILQWRDELVRAGVIVLYSVEGKFYVKIKQFNQRLRLMQSKFPQPETGQIHAPSNDGHLSDNGRPETKRNEEETETETKVNGGETRPAADAVNVWPSFEDFWDKYEKKEDRLKCEKKWKTIKQGAREKIMEHLELYVRSTPDKKYRKNPITYLNNESWNNEIIIPTNGTTPTPRLTAQGTLDRLNSYTD
jgi:hypothetical protein